MGRRVSRQALYDLVWSEPISKLTTHFGVSGPAIAKSCAKMHVPVPPRGYWARKAAGRTVIRAMLAPRPAGLNDEIEIGGGHDSWRYRQHTDEELLGSLPPEPVFDEPIEAVRARVDAAVGKVTVARDLEQPHPIVAQLLEQSEERRAKLREHPYMSAFDGYAPRFDTPIQRRGLRILSTLLLALARSGCKAARYAGQDPTRVAITVGHQTVVVGLKVVEEKQRGKAAGVNPKSPVKHRLRFEIKPRDDGRPAERPWEDNEQPLERQLREIVVAVIVAAEQQHRDNCLWSYHRRVECKLQLEAAIRQRQLEAERVERERLAALERARIEHLLGEAAALRQAGEIRRYVEEVRVADAAADDPLPDAVMSSWSAWALAQADRIDPIKNGAFRAPYDDAAMAGRAGGGDGKPKA